MKRIAAIAGLLTALACAGQARADVSSWAYLGTGMSSLKQQNLELRTDPTLAIETGIGSTPKQPLIVGGLLKLPALLGDGTDRGEDRGDEPDVDQWAAIVGDDQRL